MAQEPRTSCFEYASQQQELTAAFDVLKNNLARARCRKYCFGLALHETMHTHAQNRVARLFIEKPGPAN
jgi:hypothetical protein